jgi:glycosyltransferase involved in cell wall biosynthesis
LTATGWEAGVVHVVLVNLCYPGGAPSPDALLERFSSLGGWAEALVGEGVQATVVQRFHLARSFERHGVRYRFVADRSAPELPWWRRSLPAERAVLGEAVRQGGPAVVHVHGLRYGLQARAMRRRLPWPVTVVVQHHGELPPRWPVRPLLSRGLSAVDGAFFTARELVAPWLDAGLLSPARPVIEVVEASTGFCRRPQREARAETGLDGDPVVLWVGRLDPNKDPLTVLAGFEAALAGLPDARLYMAYSDHCPLLDAVRTRIAGNPRLEASVRLLGAVPHERIEAVFNSADLFVLGSHREGSGFALLEAMACGAIPVVTAIPSFRAITADGAVGALWPTDDASACAAALLAAAAPPLAASSAAVCRHFEQHLSYPALARRALAAYRELAALRPVPRHEVPQRADQAGPGDHRAHRR